MRITVDNRIFCEQKAFLAKIIIDLWVHFQDAFALEPLRHCVIITSIITYR
jgi:hypothetical protein